MISSVRFGTLQENVEVAKSKAKATGAAALKDVKATAGEALLLSTTKPGSFTQAAKKAGKRGGWIGLAVLLPAAYFLGPFSVLTWLAAGGTGGYASYKKFKAELKNLKTAE